MWYKYCVFQQNYNDFAKQINNPYSPNLGRVKDIQDDVTQLDSEYSETSSPLEKAQEDAAPDVHAMTIEELLESGRTDPKESGKLGYNKYLDKKHPENGANASIFEQNQSNSPPWMKGSGGAFQKGMEPSTQFPPANGPATIKWQR